MTIKETAASEVTQSAYDAAWNEHVSIPGLTPSEILNGRERLRCYILIDTGERAPTKIARSAVSMMREHEQIIRSMGRARNRRRLPPAA